MATVYSLICWGGRTGKTVTLTDAGDIVNSTNHGLRDGTPVQFASGTLPAGLALNTTYYAKSTGADTLTLYTTAALTTQITWSGAGTGPFYLKSKAMIDYMSAYSGRWGASGSERIYDGLASWRAFRFNAALPYDTEICELGEAFDDRIGSSISMTIPAARVEITPTVNDVRTSAHHNGVYGGGYAVKSTATWGSTFAFTGLRHELSGISIYVLSNESSGGVGFNNQALFNVVRDLFIIGNSGGGQDGLGANGKANTISNIVVTHCTTGISIASYEGGGVIISNCLAAKCVNGFALGEAALGFSTNNISVGNTNNWVGSPANLTAAAFNFGISTDSPFNKGADTAIKTLVADNTCFVSWAGNDYRPASASAPQVDSVVAVVGMDAYDINGKERPNYNNGGAEAWDGGPFEFDHGFVRPVTATLTLTGLSSGTDVVVRSAGTSTILASVDSTSGAWDYTYTTPHSVDIDVIKPGMVIVTLRSLSLTASSASIPISQQLDRNYS